MDKLFDLLNSRPECGPPAFTGHSSDIYFMNEMVELFSRIRVVDVDSHKDNTNTVKFLKGLIISIKSVQNLFDELRLEYGFLFTRRLSQGCLEIFFGMVRSQNGNYTNPNCYQFFCTFKKLFALNFMFVPLSNTNCEKEFDFEESMKFFKIIGQHKSKIVKRNQIIKLGSEKICVLKKFNLSVKCKIPEKNSLTYFAGFLLKKCLLHHNCNACKTNVQSKLTSSNLLSSLKNKKTPNLTFGSIMVPTTNFVTYIQKLEEIFITNFWLLANKQNFSKQLETMMSIVKLKISCNSFPRKFLVNFFVRCRIHFALRRFNQALHSKNWVKTKNLKLKKICNK